MKLRKRKQSQPLVASVPSDVSDWGDRVVMYEDDRGRPVDVFGKPLRAARRLVKRSSAR